jgi:dipeptidyl aminopeptidase/acylaminoacyl peptidase
MNEEEIHFESEGQRIYGMLHLPDSEGPHPTVALLHGFTGTRIESHRLFVKTARRMAERGMAALRFDFRGSGESEGDFVEMTIQGEIADARQAINYLEGRPEVNPDRIGLLGLSLGGVVAACLAGQDRRVKALALWATPDLRQFASSNAPSSGVNWDSLREKGWMDWGGNRVGRGFFEGTRALDPFASLEEHEGPVLVVHGTRDATVPIASGKRYATALQDRVEAHWIEGADHTFSKYEWESEVIGLTTEWFLKQL